MNATAIRLTARVGARFENRAASKVTSSVKEYLKTLSLAAPQNWVQKNGAKRRCASNAN